MDNGYRRNKGSSYSAEQVKRVLSGSGIDISSELDSDYLIFCPFHSNFRTPAGEVNKESGLFFCFSCQESTGLVELVMHQTGRSYFESTRFIKSKQASDQNIASEIDKRMKQEPEYVPFDEVLVKRLNVEAMRSEKAVSYFRNRKITEESMRFFDLGYSEKTKMVTIPMHSPDSVLVGFVGRSVEGKEFKNTVGLPKGKILFNLHRVKTSKSVYVVESSFDAIRLHQVGFPAVATLGANVSNKQIELLQKYFNDIIVIADNDEAGENMKDRLKTRLGSKISSIQLNKEYKDIGDMDDESIKNLEYRFDKTIASMLN